MIPMGSKLSLEFKSEGIKWLLDLLLATLQEPPHHTSIHRKRITFYLEYFHSSFFLPQTTTAPIRVLSGYHDVDEENCTITASTCPFISCRTFDNRTNYAAFAILTSFQVIVVP
jgi:hypothetical protein